MAGLLNIAAELRNDIYELVIGNAPVLAGGYGLGLPSLFQTCQQIRMEGGRLFMGRAIVEVDLHLSVAGQPTLDIQELMELSRALGSPLHAIISKMVIKISGYTSPESASLVRVLGGLQDLCGADPITFVFDFDEDEPWCCPATPRINFHFTAIHNNDLDGETRHPYVQATAAMLRAWESCRNLHAVAAILIDVHARAQREAELEFDNEPDTVTFLEHLEVFISLL